MNICTQCHTVNEGVKKTPGSFALELLIWGAGIRRADCGAAVFPGHRRALLYDVADYQPIPRLLVLRAHRISRTQQSRRSKVARAECRQGKAACGC